MTLATLEDVLAEQVADLQSAEDQLIHALPKMAQAATTPDLREAFQNHLDETRGHAERLKKVAGELNGHIPSETCEAMKGLIKEGEEIIQEGGDPTAVDAALIGAAQRVEHYEIAAYGTAKALAKELGHKQMADLLNETLQEESAADKLLTDIASGGMLRSGVNSEAAR
jgi:ferritin-like metal-binding protein YciE